MDSDRMVRRIAAAVAAISSGHVTATYLYCIVKAAKTLAMGRVPAGLPGAERPEALAVTSALWIIVAAVPLETYGPEPLERHLSDLDWVGRIALAHESVVEHFAQRAGGTVIPMKLFTMFSSPDRAVADVLKRRAPIAAAMRRITGAEEWGVRIMRDTAAGVAPRAAAIRATSGAAFLAAKKHTRDEARRARLAAAEVAVGAFTRLSSIARDARRREDAPAAGAVPPLLDAAFLVAESSRVRFKNVAKREAVRCAEAGARMTLTGPWPAYNFVQGDEHR
jgi:hypothetical protein